MNDLLARANCARLRIAALFLLSTGLPCAADQATPGKVPLQRDFSGIQREVETLRGKKFLRPVPVYKISANVLRRISDHDLDKEYPGEKLHYYEELLAWLDMVPPGTDLKAVEAAFSVNEVAGLYDSDSKEMCIPSSATQTANAAAKPAEKKAERITLANDDIVLAHEFTHALEDQYWPIDDPKDEDTNASTDRGTSHDFVLEGSATREMLEAVPSQWSESPNGYFFLWNLIHSEAGEYVLNCVMKGSWKSPDVVVQGVPETLVRTESMPYSFGYSFCTGVMRDWGLDGLDYFYNHPLVSSTQVMHPKKAWEWREFPTQIDLPEDLAGGWKQISIDSVGEAGMAVLFGCQFKNLYRGEQLALGWNGDHVALFAGPGERRLLLWASAWDSAYDAGVFARACVKERQAAHHAVLTKDSGKRIEWQSPDGRAGLVLRRGNQVMLLETDYRETLKNAGECLRGIRFTEPPEKAARAAINSPWQRFNPFYSWQKDGDYAVNRTLGGLLSREDRNSVGAANTLLLGLVSESRHTASFEKWEFGGTLIARHESDARRGVTKTTWLPLGLLASHCSARLPQSPEKTITRASVLWGLGASKTKDERGEQTMEVLPFGLLWRRTTGTNHTSFYILGTGVSRTEASDGARVKKCSRLFGIPVRTTSSRRSN
ncbi:MAG: hypothetical protein ACLQVY_29240 [Limisphaerales bacterium]